jgi:SHS2 domain-containing protein
MAAVAGHRHVAQDGGWAIDAWGPDTPSCATEALKAVVETFARTPDRPTARVVPLSSGVADGPEDALASVLEEVIDDIDVFSLVPVRFHLGEPEDGGLAGDMEAVPSREAELLGPAPTSVLRHGLSMSRQDGTWHCHVVVTT